MERVQLRLAAPEKKYQKGIYARSQSFFSHHNNHLHLCKQREWIEFLKSIRAWLLRSSQIFRSVEIGIQIPISTFQQLKEIIKSAVNYKSEGHKTL
jgi:hypothetical protein